MADATIKAWKCDVCGRTYMENQPWYGQKYELHLKPHVGLYADDIHCPDVCHKCAEQIDWLIEKLKDGGTVGEM